MSNPFDQMMQDIDQAMPFIKAHGATVWSNLRREIGRDLALEQVGRDRKDILSFLRIEYGMTLQQVGNIFDLSRERIRQLTPAGLWHSSSSAVNWTKIISRVAKKAVMSSAAWTTKGKVKRSWVLEHFGEDVARRLPDIHRSFNKLEMILRFRVGLQDETECLRWIEQKYFSEGRTYSDIARLLSKYVSISTMCVYRNAVEMGFKGYPPGRRFDLDL